VRRALLVVLFLALAAPATAGATIPLAAHPSAPRYGSQVTLSGTAAPGDVVELFYNGASTGQTADADSTTGDFGFAFPAIQPGAYHVETASGVSDPVDLKLKPILTRRMAGLRYPGNRLVLKGRLRPASAASLTLKVGARDWHVRVKQDGHYTVFLPTDRLGRHRARLVLAPHQGYKGFTARRYYRILAPALSTGAHGTAVRALERRLATLRHIVRGGPNGYYAYDTYEAVLAFQKVHRMARTGRVSRGVWRVLGRAKVPKARVARGNHVEVSKTLQVLYEVRKGKVVRITHVSTGATGNTPVGKFHVYGKVPGLNGSGMYYSLFFTGAFAIHGYHSVPAYQASHGCVRTPMWFAPGFYDRWAVGTTVYIFA
jgi:L,D-transpeptidase catalytic domain/Putative peptidoglycan binding domain